MNVGTITDGLCDENWKIGVYEYVHISLHRKIWYMQNMYLCRNCRLNYIEGISTLGNFSSVETL